MQKESEQDIKRRLEKEALRAWGHSENERMDVANTFDPLVNLLLSACAVEFGKMNREILESRNRVLTSAIELLAPEVYTRPHPAYSIMHARPKEAHYTLETDNQFSVLTKTQEVFFTPATSFKLCNGDVRFLAFHDQIVRVDQIPDRTTFITGKSSLPPQQFWIGLDLDITVNSLESLCFFWDWHDNTTKSDLYYQLLSLAKWSLEGYALQTQSGIDTDYESRQLFSEKLSGFHEEYSITHKIEKDILTHYHQKFVTLQGFRQDQNNDELNLYRLRRTYPIAFESCFSVADLVSLNENRLLWIKVDFPSAFPSEMLAKVDCLINSFPVINRRLIKHTKNLRDNINIIALETKDFFLDIKSLYDSHELRYHSIPLTNVRNYQAGTYTLRKDGVGRFDNRNARDMLNQLIDLLRDESAAFSALNKKDFLDSRILRLNQEIAELEQFIKKENLDGESTPYLIVRAPRKDETVVVEYWVTQGKSANQLAFGIPVEMGDVLPLEKNSLKLVTSPKGGRNRPNLEESLAQYKHAMLSRGRIVTHQDIKSFCIASLGEQLVDVKVAKETFLGELPFQGLVRVIKVSVFLKKQGIYDDESWNEVRQFIESQLNEYSTKVLPIQVEFFSVQ